MSFRGINLCVSISPFAKNSNCSCDQRICNLLSCSAIRHKNGRPWPPVLLLSTQLSHNQLVIDKVEAAQADEMHMLVCLPPRVEAHFVKSGSEVKARGRKLGWIDLCQCILNKQILDVEFFSKRGAVMIGAANENVSVWPLKVSYEKIS